MAGCIGRGRPRIASPKDPPRAPRAAPRATRRAVGGVVRCAQADRFNTEAAEREEKKKKRAERAAKEAEERKAGKAGAKGAKGGALADVDINAALNKSLVSRRRYVDDREEDIAAGRVQRHGRS